MEADSSEGSRIVKDTLHLTEVGAVGEDCQLAIGLGSKWQEVDGIGPSGPKKTLDPSLTVGQGLLSKPDPSACRKWHRVLSFCNGGPKPNFVDLERHFPVGADKQKQRKGEGVVLRSVRKKLESESYATNSGFGVDDATPKEFLCYRWWLLSSTADSHENTMLECPWVWEPMGHS